MFGFPSSLFNSYSSFTRSVITYSVLKGHFAFNGALDWSTESSGWFCLFPFEGCLSALQHWGCFPGCPSDLINSHCKTETLKMKVTLLFAGGGRNAGNKYEWWRIIFKPENLSIVNGLIKSRGSMGIRVDLIRQLLSRQNYWSNCLWVWIQINKLQSESCLSLIFRA